MKNDLMSVSIQHFKIIDEYSLKLANDFKSDKTITYQMIQAIVDFYDTANIEKNINTERFTSAYHTPVTADFEFLLARLLFHIGILYKKEWKIDLRRQEKKATPDIRISNGGKTLWILELKVGMSWAKSFICPTFYKKAIKKYEIDNKWDPDLFNRKCSLVLDKYSEIYSIPKEKIFLVIPSLASIHYRRESKHLNLNDYRNHFNSVSGLPNRNLVIFNNNLLQNLANPKEAKVPFQPTMELESMITKLIND